MNATPAGRPAVTVLAGGVGAARYLTGQLQVTAAHQVVAVVNTADDEVLHGLHVSPDVDTVIYTLCGQINQQQGWGLRNETWNALTRARALGLDAWFQLGDLDIGTHLARTSWLADGVPLSEVTRRLAVAQGVECGVLPMSDDPVRTMVTLATGEEIGFQEYFVRLAHGVHIAGVRFAGADNAKPAPGVLEAVNTADVVVVAPSNPVVSIGPVLAVAGVRDALAARRERNVAVSPIVAGAALKGPADTMMRDLGETADVVGVARRYRDLIGALVIDQADAAHRDAVEAEGVRAVVTNTIMDSPAAAARLARSTVGCVTDPSPSA